MRQREAGRGLERPRRSFRPRGVERVSAGGLARRSDIGTPALLGARRPPQHQTLARGLARGVETDRVGRLAERLQDSRMVFEAAEEFRAHLERLERKQSASEHRARGVAGARCALGLARPPQRRGLAALVLGGAEHVEGAREAGARARQVAAAQRKLAEIAFALALELAVLDVQGDRKALREVRSRGIVVGELLVDLAQVQEADRLADAIAQLAEDRERFLLARPRLHEVALVQADHRERGQRRRDLAPVGELPAQIEAGRQQLARFRVVALVVREHTGDVERVRVHEGRLLHARKRERGAHRVAAFRRVAAEDPEAHQRDAELDGEDRVGLSFEREAGRGAQVVELRLQAPRPLGLIGTLQVAVARLGHAEEVVAVPHRDLRGVVPPIEILARELADRLELPVARAEIALVDHHQRLLDERRQQIEHVDRVERLAAAYRLRRVEIEAADEDGQSLQQPLLGLLQHVVRPRDERAQRLLALEQHAPAAGQKLEAVLQPLVDVLDGHRAHPRGGELERERNAFEARAELGDGRRLALRQRETRLLQLRPIHEQLHRIRARQRFDARRARRERKRQHRIRLLARDAQRFPAGRDDGELRRGTEQRVGEVRAGAHHVLAVVEDEQEPARLHVRAQRLRQRLAGLLAHAEGLGGHVGHEQGIADRGEVEEPDAVGIRVERVGCDLQRQPRLAEAAHAQQREEPRLAEQRGGLGKLPLASDERRELFGQVVGRRFERAQCGEILPELRMDELADLLGRRQVLQPHAAELAQRDPAGQAFANEIGERPRQQHLPAVRDAHDPRGAVDRGAEVVVVALDRVTRMQSAAHADRDVCGCGGVGERGLKCDDGCHRVRGIGKRRVDAVAGRLDHAAPVHFDGGAHQRVVLRHGPRRALRVLFPHPGAAFDVGEQEGDRVGRRIHAGIPCGWPLRASPTGVVRAARRQRCFW